MIGISCARIQQLWRRSAKRKRIPLASGLACSGPKGLGIIECASVGVDGGTNRAYSGH